MKLWKCMSCATERFSDNKIVMRICPACQEEMELIVKEEDKGDVKSR